MREKSSDKNDKILQPAYQKFYSSLININRFRLENQLFENISYLDNFFTEFRNITFVLYKSLPEGSNNSVYKKLSKKYFSKPEMKWVVDKRNAETHENPTSFSRIFIIEIYGISSIIKKRSFMYDDEYHPQEDIMKEILSILSSIEEDIEINFSVRHLIVDDKDTTNIDMLSLIREGVNTMWEFLKEMRMNLDENLSSIGKLEKEIITLVSSILHNDILFTIDYVYDVKNQKTQAATRGIAIYDLGKKTRSLKDTHFDYLGKPINIDSNLDLYRWFIVLHLAMYKSGARDLMSTFFIIFNDKTFLIQPYFSTLRSTTYRMINEIAEMVENGNIRAVIYLWEGICYSSDQWNLISNLTHENRKKYSTKEGVQIELLSERMVRTVSFNPEQLNDESYISNILNNLEGKLSGPMLLPIAKAFQNLKQK